MADQVIRSFQALSTKAERLLVLQKFVQTLDHDECSAVGTAISRRRDLFFALPLELVVQVFDYLEILDTWRLQLVCRHWRECLSSDDFLRAAVSRWQTHEPSDSALVCTPNRTSDVQQDIRHTQAQICKKPFSVLILDDTGAALLNHPRIIWQQRMDLKGRRIAYVSTHHGQGDTVIVRDLINGASWTLHGEARERISHVVLTTTLVAFITYDGCLYVSTFSSLASLSETKRVRLPSCLVRGCGAHMDRVAIAMGGAGRDLAYVSEVLFLNATSMRLSSVEVASTGVFLEGESQRVDACGVIVDCKRETVDVFTLVHTEPTRLTNNLQMLHLRISTNGNKASLERSTKQSICSCLHRQLLFTIANPAPTGIQGQYRIEVCQSFITAQPPLHHTINVLFDMKHGRVQPIPEPERNEVPNRVPDEVVAPSAVWKGRSHRPASLEHEWVEHTYMMNDTFLMSLEVNKASQRDSRVRIFCYDERVRMAQGQSTGLWEVDCNAQPA